MTTVIDSLVISLGLDTSQFTEQQRRALADLRSFQEAANEQNKITESQTRRLGDTLSSFRREIISSAAMFLGGRGAKEFVDHITNLDASTGRFSKTLGVSARELAIWQGIIKQVGGNAEGANSALGSLNAQMVAFDQAGDPAIIGTLNQLDVGLYKANGQLKTATELIFDITESIERKGIDSRQASGFLSRLGIGGDMANVILKGTAALREYYRASEDATSSTNEGAASAEKYQRSMANLSTSAESLGRALVMAMNPDWWAKAITNQTEGLNALRDTPEQRRQREQRDTAARGGRTFSQDVRSRFGKPPQWWRNLIGDKDDETPAPTPPVTLPGPFAGAGQGSGPNWARFMKGLSYLETSQRNVPAWPGHSAEGFFQFQPATASDARKAGIPDPRFGSYEQQAGATQRFIQTFHPAAAAAIDRGDFAVAQAMLKGRWPSLPGGSQPQSPARYGTFNDILGGGGGSRGATVSIDKIEVNAPRATDAEGIGQEIGPALKRAVGAAAANFGAI